MRSLSSLARRVFWAVIAVMGVVAESYGADSYADGLLICPSVTIGTKTYGNMIVTVAGYSYGFGNLAAGSGDNYDPVSHLLTSPAVTAGSTTYNNVSATVGTLVSVGSVAGGDSYDGHYLILSSVALGGMSYSNVVVTIGKVLAVSGRMPAVGEDEYDAASRQLTMPAVVAGGRVFTNVVVTIAQVVSVGSVVPVPALSQILPGTVTAGIQGVQLTANGTGFTGSSVMLWNGSVLPTSYVSAATLTAQVPAADLVIPGLATVNVATSAVGGTASNGRNLTVTPAQQPAITSLSPNILDSGGAAFFLTVVGTNFTRGAVVGWNGSARATTYVSATQLAASITAPDIAAPGSASVTVLDPASYGIPSNVLTFTIAANIAPSLTMISPTIVPAGGQAFRLTIIGTGFLPASQAYLNGASLTTISEAPGMLTAVVPASAIASIGTAQVTIVNPAIQGGASSPLTLAIVAPSIDAVSFQMDGGHTGYVNFRSVTLPKAASWSYNLGSTPSYAVIVGGNVYVSGADGDVVALDGKTGATVWGPIGFGGLTGLAYDSGILFVTSGSFLVPTLLTAMDPATGDVLWAVRVLPGEFDMANFPVATQGLVFVLNGGRVTAIDESSGATVWTKRVSSNYGAPAVTVDGLYLSMECIALDLQPATGSVLWSIQTVCGGGGGATPTVGGGRIYAPISGQLNGNIYTQETGSLIGSYVVTSPPAISGTTAYLLENSTLQATALSNDQVLWSFSGDGQLVTAPIVVNNYVFIGSSAGNLYALDASTGAQLEKVNLGAPIPAPENGSNGGYVESGLSAGDGLLVVPAGNTVNAFVLSTNP